MQKQMSDTCDSPRAWSLTAKLVEGKFECVKIAGIRTAAWPKFSAFVNGRHQAFMHFTAWSNGQINLQKESWTLVTASATLGTKY